MIYHKWDPKREDKGRGLRCLLSFIMQCPMCNMDGYCDEAICIFLLFLRNCLSFQMKAYCTKHKCKAVSCSQIALTNVCHSLCTTAYYYMCHMIMMLSPKQPFFPFFKKESQKFPVFFIWAIYHHITWALLCNVCMCASATRTKYCHVSTLYK